MEEAEAGVLRVALVSLGERLTSLDSWHCRSSPGKLCLSCYPASRHQRLPCIPDIQITANSFLIPISSYLLTVFRKMQLNMTDLVMRQKIKVEA